MSYTLYGDLGSGAFSAEAAPAEAGSPYSFELVSLEPDWKLANLPKLMALADNVAKRPAIAPVWARHFPA